MNKATNSLTLGLIMLVILLVSGSKIASAQHSNVLVSERQKSDSLSGAIRKALHTKPLVKQYRAGRLLVSPSEVITELVFDRPRSLGSVWEAARNHGA